MIAIGRPADNVTLRVVDASDKPVPIGAVGELLVGGPGVAAGYLHRPDLTGERFTAGPEGGTEDEPEGRSEVEAEARHYRTGDLVRWAADGRLVFVGRTDDQVKIRGFRVEPEEVAQVLGRLDGVRRAAVVGLRRANGEAFLAAYVVPTEPGRDSTAEQRSRTDRWAEELNHHLPEYMVPRAWRVLTELPLTANGKLDRTRLPSAGPFLPADAPSLPADGEGARRAAWPGAGGRTPHRDGERASRTLGGRVRPHRVGRRSGCLLLRPGRAFAHRDEAGQPDQGGVGRRVPALAPLPGAHTARHDGVRARRRIETGRAPGPGQPASSRASPPCTPATPSRRSSTSPCGSPSPAALTPDRSAPHSSS